MWAVQSGWTVRSTYCHTVIVYISLTQALHFDDMEVKPEPFCLTSLLMTVLLHLSVGPQHVECNVVYSMWLQYDFESRIKDLQQPSHTSVASLGESRYMQRWPICTATTLSPTGFINYSTTEVNRKILY